MVMRLAELYLIRAEASLLLSDSNRQAAINDLNALRQSGRAPGPAGYPERCTGHRRHCQ